MKKRGPRAVFVLTAGGGDMYYQMTRLAVASLKITNPQVDALVICDDVTDSLLRRSKAELRAEVDEWISLSTPKGPNEFRNRFLKTSLRQILDGPFLFLDGDIVIRGDLMNIFRSRADVAGARNHSQPELALQIWDQDAQAISDMGWTFTGQTYLNGGVLFWNDSRGARRASEEWHRRWLASVERLGRFRDQPALNTAIGAAGASIEILADRYNAQFKTRPSAARDATVWHYYSSAGAVPSTRPELLTHRMLAGESLFEADLIALSQAKHPWRATTCLDDLAAARVTERDSFSGWAGAVLERRLFRHLAQLTSRSLGFSGPSTP
jgi:hypothetical protein